MVHLSLLSLSLHSLLSPSLFFHSASRSASQQCIFINYHRSVVGYFVDKAQHEERTHYRELIKPIVAFVRRSLVADYPQQVHFAKNYNNCAVLLYCNNTFSMIAGR